MAQNIDKSQSMQEFIKGKVIKELAKGVASMREFVYPSVLQSAAIPALKKTEAKNIIVRYSEMSGIKLTLLLPVLNSQIKHAVVNDEEGLLYTLVLCNTNARCMELAAFASELTKFCKDVVDVIQFEHIDFQDVKHDWKQRTETQNKIRDDADDEQKAEIKLRNKVLFVTPSLASIIFSKGLLTAANSKCFSVIIDKINMHQAFDLDQDLIELSKEANFPAHESIVFKTVFTTNLESEKTSDETQKENYNSIKKCYMGAKDKANALVIQLNQEHR